MANPLEVFLWSCVQRLGRLGFAGFCEYDRRRGLLLPPAADAMAGEASVTLAPDLVAPIGGENPEPPGSLAGYVAHRYLAMREGTPLVISGLKRRSAKGRRDLERFLLSLPKLGGVPPDFAACAAVVLSGKRPASRLAGVLVLLGATSRGIPEEEVAGLVGVCAAHVVSSRKLRQEAQLAGVLSRLQSLLIPRSVGEVLDALRQAMDGLGTSHEVPGPLKYMAYWSCSSQDASILLIQQCAHGFTGAQSVKRGESWALFGSAVSSPPSQDLYWLTASHWVQTLESGSEIRGLPTPSSMAVRERVSRVRKDLCDGKDLTREGLVDDADLALLIPVLGRCEGDASNRPHLKGLLALFLDRDVESDGLPSSFIDELSKQLAIQFDRARLWQDSTLRAVIARSSPLLLAGERTPATFLEGVLRRLAEVLNFGGASAYLYDRSSRQLYLVATTGLFEAQYGQPLGRRVASDEYPRVRYSAQSPGTRSWQFFEPFADQGCETALRQRLCQRTTDDDFGCPEDSSSCSRFSEAARKCVFRLDTLMQDQDGKGVGLLRCVNRGQEESSRLPAASPTEEEREVVRDFAEALGVLLELWRRSTRSDQLLRKVSHELPHQIGLVLQNLDEIQAEVLGSLRRAERRRALPAHLQNLLDETGYSALVIQYHTNISTLLSLTPEQVEYGKRPLKLHVLLAKVLERIRHQARERGIYVRYSGSLELARPVFLADRSFDLALINILNNAVQYSAFCTCALVDWLDRGDHFELTVSDLGIPLPRGVPQGTVFEDGYRSPEAKAMFPSGTGFGLTVARHVIKAHRFELVPQCLAEPVASRNVFALDYFSRPQEAWIPELRAMGLELRDERAALVDVRRRSKILLDLSATERSKVEEHSQFQIPDLGDNRIRRIPLEYLKARLDCGDDLDILWKHNVDRPLYSVNFAIRIPRSEVVK